MSDDIVIPAYPYEGAFYWFLAAGRAHSQDHPYYRVLYGPNPSELGTQAAAIASLYPNILLGAADAQLPDFQRHMSGRQYHHPDLRVSLNWDDNEWAPETQAVARAAAAEPHMQQLLAAHMGLSGDQKLQHHFLCRAALQIRLAARTGGTLVGDEFFQRIYSAVAPWVIELLDDPPQRTASVSKLMISETTLKVVGLNFSPANLDAFAAIRGSEDVATYAASFRAALSEAHASGDLESRLLDLMAEAMDSGDVAMKAARAFQTAGSVVNVLGLIPVVGTVASAAGLVTDTAGRIATSRAGRADWFLLGAKLKEVAIRDALKRRRSG
jgi:hypothetical protein